MGTSRPIARSPLGEEPAGSDRRSPVVESDYGAGDHAGPVLIVSLSAHRLFSLVRGLRVLIGHGVRRRRARSVRDRNRVLAEFRRSRAHPGFVFGPVRSISGPVIQPASVPSSASSARRSRASLRRCSEPGKRCPQRSSVKLTDECPARVAVSLELAPAAIQSATAVWRRSWGAGGPDRPLGPSEPRTVAATR